MHVLEMIFGLAYWIVPVVVGYLVSRFRPRWSWWKCGLVSGLPFALGLFGFAIWIGLTQDMSCDPVPCNNMAPLFFWGLLAGSVFTLGLGFVLGLVGRAFAPRMRQSKGK